MTDVWVVLVPPEEPEVFVSRERAYGRVEELLGEFVAAARMVPMRGGRDEAEVGKWLSDVEARLSEGEADAAAAVWNEFAAKYGYGSVEFLAGSLIQ